MTYSILIVEDQGIASAGVKFTLDADPRFVIKDSVDTVNKARIVIPELKPDFIILDIFLSDGSGLDLLKELNDAEGNRPGIIVYSGQANPQEFAQALQLGAEAIISKADPPEELKSALDALIRDESYLSVSVSRNLSLGAQATLTSREQQILQLLFNGLDSNEIGERLGTSPATVKKHRENILTKLDVPNTVAATRLGIRLGLIDVNTR